MVVSSQFLSTADARDGEYGSTLFDRDLSWVAFNRRLIYEVADRTLPLLNRVTKLAQAATELDEYFMMRMPDVYAKLGKAEQKRIQSYLRPLSTRQEALFGAQLRPLLAEAGITILHYAELDDMQRAHCHRRFEDEILSVLMPLLTPPTDAPPDFTNLSLYLAVQLLREQESTLAWVKIPRLLPRFVELAVGGTGDRWVLVPIEQVVAAHAAALFPEYTLQGAYPLRVTRSADLGDLDSEESSLMERIQESLQQRHREGRAVRLEVLTSMPEAVRSPLMTTLQIPPEATYRLREWLALRDLQTLTHLPRPDLALGETAPVLPAPLRPAPRPTLLSFVSASALKPPDLFTVLQHQDLLLHFPYHDFTATVETFIAAAAMDPDVLTLKVTLYRTAVDAPIVRSLVAAAKTGKQIVVLVELTAPLDEAINIHWAKNLSKAGAHVVYGVVGFRTHTNLALAVRREGKHLRQYAYVGTGDYLPNRPQPYEDLGLLTCRPEITQDLSHLFNYLTGCALPFNYPTVMVAPGQLRQRLHELLAREMAHAQAGRPAHIIVKLNLLADPDMIGMLYQVSQAGVTVDLIVRGTCRLRPGIPGLSDRIRVISILGRYIEHSRVLYCANGGNPEAWIGTADWTPRGLDDRIEVMVPVLSPTLISDLRQRLDCWLADNQNAWILQPDGRYLRRHPQPEEPPCSAHITLQTLVASENPSSRGLQPRP